MEDGDWLDRRLAPSMSGLIALPRFAPTRRARGDLHWTARSTGPGFWKRLLPERRQATDPSLPRYLDEGAIDTPSLAITNAARETLRMGDLVETMLSHVMTAIMANDRKLAGEVSKADNAVDRLDGSSSSSTLPN